MITVYVWNETFVPHHSWGHASLEVDDVYISWWPTKSKSKHNMKKKKFEGRTCLPKNYEDDKENYMGRAADRAFYIPSSKVNPTQVKQWWRQKEKDGYHFFFNNCCDIVVKALRAGGAVIPFKLIRTPYDTAVECAVLTGELIKIPIVIRALNF